jgi:hypothetical protein
MSKKSFFVILIALIIIINTACKKNRFYPEPVPISYQFYNETKNYFFSANDTVDEFYGTGNRANLIYEFYTSCGELLTDDSVLIHFSLKLHRITEFLPQIRFELNVKLPLSDVAKVFSDQHGKDCYVAKNVATLHNIFKKGKMQIAYSVNDTNGSVIQHEGVGVTFADTGNYGNYYMLIRNDSVGMPLPVNNDIMNNIEITEIKIFDKPYHYTSSNQLGAHSGNLWGIPKIVYLKINFQCRLYKQNEPNKYHEVVLKNGVFEGGFYTPVKAD